MIELFAVDVVIEYDSHVQQDFEILHAIRPSASMVQLVETLISHEKAIVMNRILALVDHFLRFDGFFVSTIGRCKWSKGPVFL